MSDIMRPFGLLLAGGFALFLGLLGWREHVFPPLVLLVLVGVGAVCVLAVLPACLDLNLHGRRRAQSTLPAPLEPLRTPADHAAALSPVPPPSRPPLAPLVDVELQPCDRGDAGPADAVELEDRPDAAAGCGRCVAMAGELDQLAEALGVEHAGLRRRIDSLEALHGGQTAAEAERWLRGES